jgi:hypothetical protein
MYSADPVGLTVQYSLATSIKKVTFLLLVFPLAYVDAIPLNDTGVINCANSGGVIVSCTDPTAVAGQDARYGRDAAAATGGLVKTGSGVNGFDFTKISNSGARLQPNVSLGTAANQWACTLDETTGLMWEVKANSGLRDKAHTYRWYDSNSSTNGGNVGAQSDVADTFCYEAGRCDMQKFRDDVNLAGLCGFSDWKVPTLRELLSIFRMSDTPDPSFFPDGATLLWTSNTVAWSPAEAWWIERGQAFPRYGNDKGIPRSIRLVRKHR